MTDAEKIYGFVSEKRLMQRIENMASFGLRPDGGVSREALSQADHAARRFFAEEGLRLGCSITVDNCANIFIRREGREGGAPVVIGSHLDTQPIGGKLDGAYGVVGGLEVIAAMNDGAIVTRSPVEVVAWTNEEGSRFQPGAMGSHAFVEPDKLKVFRESIDINGMSFGSELDRFFSAFPDLKTRKLSDDFNAYIELHIEQGPILESAGVPVGIVSGIQGVRWYRVTCNGRSSHAGTTPLHMRSDPVVAATNLVQRLLGQATEDAGHQLRVTVGQWSVQPNSVNTIPSRVDFSIDARSPIEGKLREFESFLVGELEERQWRGDVKVEFERLLCVTPSLFSPALVEMVSESCRYVCSMEGANKPLVMASGAFHDAMYLARHCPSAMIFVPSIGGVSHNAAEDTAPKALVAGVRALAHATINISNGISLV